MDIKAIKSNGKATCIYHAIINNNDRTNELYRILNEQGAVSLGIATYYMMMDVANKMHMTVTGDEFFKLVRDCIDMTFDEFAAWCKG